jgi:BirA family biotin operon repressor/biotin-[acetyl-CoA-carboxylase] ligase
MEVSLAPPAERAGYRLAAFEEIGSTSTEALTRAAAGEAGPLWIVAGRQSAGRGRRGSSWQSPSGNLAASLLLTTELPAMLVAQLGFVAGVAVLRALDRCCPSARARPALGAGFQLKWPNDVLAGGAKLAGILLQTEEVHGRRAVVVGIGLNVAFAPAGLPYATASLRDLGYHVDAASLFTALSETWLAAHADWAEGRGFDRVRAEWLGRATGVGGAVAVRTGAAVTRGVFETIDEHGQLVLRAHDGSPRRVNAGEVHFGTTATERAGAQP